MIQPVCKLQDLQPNKPRCFRVEGVDIFVVRTEEGVFAIQNRCGHMGAPLHQGDYTDGLVVCGLHGAGFRVTDGGVEWEAILPPPISDYSTSNNPRIRHFGELIEAVETLPIKSYPVRVQEGLVTIEME